MALGMHKDTGRIFTRRAFLIGGMQVGFLGVLGTRLGWLQISQSAHYRTLSEKNRINIKLLAPSRGMILDRTGIPIAINTQNFRVVLIPEQTENAEKSLRELQKRIDLNPSDVERVLKQIKKTAKFVPVEVRDSLNWQEVTTIEVNMPDLPGVSIDVGEVRYYPLGAATAHVIGYVGAVSEADMTEDPLLRLPGFKIGKSALENTYDDRMRGKGGSSEVEVNVVGREVRELKRQPSTEGSRIMLTLDSALQTYTQERLSEQRSASAVVMNAQTGEVYTLASYPAFDPNVFARGIPFELWESLNADEQKPLMNKAVAGQYPPASTFKMITGLAGLEAGIITPHATVYCPGHFELGSTRFHCWRKEGHGSVNLRQALAVSCDTFFYRMSKDIGINAIAEMARRFGLGQKLDFELGEERPGLVPDQAWKRGRFNENWHPGETIIASIGQGYLLATPLQLAVMTARLVNGGRAVRPYLAGMIDDLPIPRPEWESMNLPQDHMDLIKAGMDDVVNGQNGTARGSRIQEEGLSMGGKTGTAQVKRITARERALGIKNEDLPWRFRHHALFVGYAPVENPIYVCAVVVEHGGGGSSAAAPIAKDILIQAQKMAPASRPMKPVDPQDLVNSVRQSIILRAKEQSP